MIFQTHKKIKNVLGFKLWRKVKRLIPITLATNIFELLSMILLFPVIQLILQPNFLSSNGFFSSLFSSLGIETEKLAVLVSFSFLLFFFIIKNILFYFVLKVQTKIQFQIATETVLYRYSSYLKQNHTFHSKNNIAVLLRNITQIPYDFVTYIIIPYVNIINELIILSLLSILIFIYNPILCGAIILFAIPAIFIYTRVYKTRLSEISAVRDKNGSLLYKLAMDSLENFTEIKLFQKTGFFTSRLKSHTDSYEKSMASNTLLQTYSPKIIETIAISSIFMVVLIGYLVETSSTDLLNFLILFTVVAFRIIPSLNKLVLSFNYIKSCSFVFDHLEYSEKFAQDLQKNDSVISEVLPFEKCIGIKSLTFAYDPKSPKVLNKLNLSIRKGQKIGIIGESGEGKSTFLSILLRFQQENEGAIYIDDVKLDENNLYKWYNLISYVPQEVQLVNGTVAENIAFGLESKEIDYMKVKSVIQSLKLSNFIDKLDNGINSYLGENNTKISGGQKQRLGLARALYHGRNVLILDEATSALDVETEKKVMQEILSLENITVVFVTHRLSALKSFDKIYQLKEGALVEVK